MTDLDHAYPYAYGTLLSAVSFAIADTTVPAFRRKALARARDRAIEAVERANARRGYFPEGSVRDCYPPSLLDTIDWEAARDTAAVGHAASERMRTLAPQAYATMEDV